MSFIVSTLISITGAYKMYSQGTRIVKLAEEIEGYAWIGECVSSPLDLIPFAEVNEVKNTSFYFFWINLLLCIAFWLVEIIFNTAVIIMKQERIGEDEKVGKTIQP